MVNFNGNILQGNNFISTQNRGLQYGDAVFETLKVSYGKILFWEDHYFRLMASMRILRMNIPMSFTMEYLQQQILETVKQNELFDASCRVKLFVNRAEGGLYSPESEEVEYMITVAPLEDDFYMINESTYEVDLFKDFYLSPSLLSTLKTNNKAINVIGSVYAKENDLHNCLLVNTNKNIVEALNGNLFVVKGNVIKTPPVSDGCLKGVMRKQIMEIVKALPDYELLEAPVSPFELQKADELFITNVITGIQPISKYRKKTYDNVLAKELLKKLNVKMRLS
ncbi:aminotransferase class IV [Mangrovimonas aestuarii]|uniref:aminotransferase class IV n=1 Tax=Mangrovimonas aestuarii TaxID=3018443 RepID=UPI0023784904|nr:aminotransferase class IV [Mangrovimonas aestuarii]